MWAVGGTLFLLTLMPACQSRQVEKPAMPVKVAEVELHAADRGARYSATIIPRTQVELAFKVDGYVEALQKVRGVDGQMRDLQEGDRITTGAVLAPLVPLALRGGPLWEPMCYAQMGGMICATFITLLLVPVIYSIFVLDLKIIKWENSEGQQAEAAGDDEAGTAQVAVENG